MTATDTAKPAAKDRPTFVLELRPEPGADPVLALRAMLKVTLRRFGMRCIRHARTSRNSDETKTTDPSDS
jgi:hypothetical protein